MSGKYKKYRKKFRPPVIILPTVLLTIANVYK